MLNDHSKNKFVPPNHQKINRRDWVTSHNPVLKAIDYTSPLTVGNGELAYTVDLTGMQSLYEDYRLNGFFLCTMSQWGWHTIPAQGRPLGYTLSDLKHTKYHHNGRPVFYASDKIQGEEEVYDWLRENPHRINLGKIGLLWKGTNIDKEALSQCRQELHLYEGFIKSAFKLHGYDCLVKTSVHGTLDIIGFSLESEALKTGDVAVELAFSYGSCDISGANWEAVMAHTTEVNHATEHELQLTRVLDGDIYYVNIFSEAEMRFTLEKHQLKLSFNQAKVDFSIRFSKERIHSSEVATSKEVFLSAEESFIRYWELGGAVSFKGSKDLRAKELERRIVLSKYLLKIQSGASMPSQETGLTCNSWYGKFHLEMHIWHAGFLPLWQHTEDLEKSLKWYESILSQAKENAKKNGYKGGRWPKMVAHQGIDCPSWIATLLIWQQPHLIYFLELMYSTTKEENRKQRLLKDYWSLIKETADFMCDFVVLNEDLDVYELKAPIIPVQEVFEPEDTHNPFFEVAYWKFTLEIAALWAKRKGESREIWDTWEKVASKMVNLPEYQGCYVPRAEEKEAFTKYQTDHPSVLMAYGFINDQRICKDMMNATLEKVLDTWALDSMWGWDFPVMAMTATRLGRPKLAVDLLLMDSPKNTYVASGNNYQYPRHDLPVYLPGNGGLLLAVAMMVAGFGNNEVNLPGFPKNDQWQITYEGIWPLPY